MNTAHKYAYESAPTYREMYEVTPKSAPAPSAARMVLISVACAMAVFLTLIGLIYIKYSVTAMQLEIISVQNEIEAQQGEALRLQAKINAQSSLLRIRQEAEALGMGYPDADHVLRVDLTELPAEAETSVTMKGEE